MSVKRAISFKLWELLNERNNGKAMSRIISFCPAIKELITRCSIKLYPTFLKATYVPIILP
jgi:hypothetical protein